MTPAQLQSIRSVLGAMTSEAKCREVFEAVLLSVREPGEQATWASSGVLFDRTEGTYGFDMALHMHHAMIDALLAE